MSGEARTHQMLGYVDPVGLGRGFLLPVFRRPQQNMLEVEIWGEGLVVAGFADLAHDTPSIALPPTETWSRLGGAAHWAFQIADTLLTGAGDEGRSALSEHLDRGALDPYPMLALEVAEFLERPDERLRRAAIVYANLSDRAEASAGAWRDLSILTPDFRERLGAVLDAKEFSRVVPQPNRVTVSVREDKVRITGLKADAKADVRILSAMQATLTHLTPLYGRRDWSFTFRRTVAPPAPPSWDGFDLDHVDALAYLAKQDDDHRLAVSARSLVEGIAVYGQDDLDVFVRQAKQFRGPSFVVHGLHTQPPRRVSTRLEVRRLISLAVRARATSRLNPEELEALASLTMPTVLVPSWTQAGLGASTGLGGELRDAALFLAHSDLDVRAQLLSRSPSAYVFVRAKGTGPSPTDDAIAQVFSRLSKLGMTGNLGFRHTRQRGSDVGIPSHTDPWRRPKGDDLGRSLFPLVRSVSSAPEFTAFDAAVLVDAHPADPEIAMRAYREAVHLALVRQGWHQGEANDWLAGPNRYFGERTEIVVDFPERRIPPHPADGIEFPSVGDISRPLQIVAHEDAGPAAILSALSHRVILASIRDLVCFPAERGEAWWLIASQMRRFSSSLPARSRSEYFAMIVRDALDARRYDQAALADPLRQILSLPEFGHGVHLHCVGIEYQPAQVVATMRIAPSRRSEGLHLRFLLIIRQDGPWLYE